MRGIMTSINEQEFEFALGRKFGEEMPNTTEPDVWGFELDSRGGFDLYELELAGWKVIKRGRKRFLLIREHKEKEERE